MIELKEPMEVNEYLAMLKAEEAKNAEPYVPKEGEQVLSVAEYSERTGMPPSTIRFQLVHNRLAGFKSGKKWFVTVASAEQDSLIVEVEKLRRENDTLKMQLACIKSILLQEVQ